MSCPNQAIEPIDHLFRRPPGESEQQNSLGNHPGLDQVGGAGDDGARFAGPGPGQHQYVSAVMFYRCPLLVV